MKTKDKKGLRLKSTKELTTLVSDTRNLISGLRLDKTQNKLKNTRQIFIKRKEVAQILTILKEKELFEVSKEKK